MTYRVCCETMDRNPALAACQSMPTLHSQVFAQPQEAVDFARQWVKDYNGVDYPRASVSRQGKFKGLAVVFNCWRKPSGEICERRNV